MKKIFIFTTLSMLLHFGLMSQTYVPFPTANASWNVYREDGFLDVGPFYTIVATYTLTGSDTIINSTKYKILIGTNSLESIGGIREQDKRIYYYSASGREEFLLYDFNAQVGDTIRHSDIGYQYSVVKGIDSVQIDGNYRKRYIVLSAPRLELDTIIEGIGSVKKGLIYAVHPLTTCLCLDYWEHICFQEHGEVKYLNPRFSDCNSTNPIAGINEASGKIEVEVSLQKDKLEIQSNARRLRSVKLITPSGVLLEEHKLADSNVFEEQLSYSGLLLCQITFDDGNFVVEKLVVNK